MADKSIGDFLGGALRGAGDRQAEARAEWEEAAHPRGPDGKFGGGGGGEKPAGINPGHRDRTVEGLAAKHLGFEKGLERQGNGEDFASISSYKARNALTAAYQEGAKAAGGTGDPDEHHIMKSRLEGADKMGVNAARLSNEVDVKGAKAGLEHAYNMGHAFGAAHAASGGTLAAEHMDDLRKIAHEGAGVVAKDALAPGSHEALTKAGLVETKGGDQGERMHLTPAGDHLVFGAQEPMRARGNPERRAEDLAPETRAEFDESAHPRGPGGKFAAASESANKATEKAVEHSTPDNHEAAMMAHTAALKGALASGDSKAAAHHQNLATRHLEALAGMGQTLKAEAVKQEKAPAPASASPAAPGQAGSAAGQNIHANLADWVAPHESPTPKQLGEMVGAMAESPDLHDEFKKQVNAKKSGAWSNMNEVHGELTSWMGKAPTPKQLHAVAWAMSRDRDLEKSVHQHIEKARAEHEREMNAPENRAAAPAPAAEPVPAVAPDAMEAKRSMGDALLGVIRSVAPVGK